MNKTTRGKIYLCVADVSRCFNLLKKKNMKIHYLLATIIVIGVGLFCISISIYLKISISFIIGISIFFIASFFAILIRNDELLSDYYEFDFFEKRKNKKEIKDMLLLRMKDAKNEELDDLINRIENL